MKACIYIYYTTQAVRGPITKISQSKCSIAGPIFSKYRTGHCPEWSRTYVFPSLCFRQSWNKSLINQACSGPYWENISPRSFSYGPRCARYVLPRPRADILPVGPSRLVNKIYSYSQTRRKWKYNYFRALLPQCSLNKTKLEICLEFYLQFCIPFPK